MRLYIPCRINFAIIDNNIKRTRDGACRVGCSANTSYEGQPDDYNRCEEDFDHRDDNQSDKVMELTEVSSQRESEPKLLPDASHGAHV
jgi:hypothetical protein